MRILWALRQRWVPLLAIGLIAYVASPWIALDAGLAAMRLRVPYVQLVGWTTFEGLEGFRACQSDCYPGIYRMPLDSAGPRPTPGGGRYVPPERR
jgi:hypothetical protein